MPLSDGNLINPKVRDAADHYANQFASAQPFRHVVIDDFLRPEVAHALLEQFPKVPDASKLVNEFGAHNPEHAVSDVRALGGAFLSMDRYIQSEDFLAFMSQTTGIPDLRYDPWYYDAGTQQNFHGAGLEAPHDFNIHPKTGYHRRINAIVYLNKNWASVWGGSINLHTNPWNLEEDVKTTIDPVFNRCVIFETNERSWHSVTKVNLPPELRNVLGCKSFTIHLYSPTRPQVEVAPDHGTVYVQEGLADNLRPGHVLTEDDVAALRRNLQRRNNHLREMYKREYKYSAAVQDLRRYVTELERSVHIPITGYAKLIRSEEPIFPDRWMGKSLRFEVECLRPIKRVTFRGWLPDTVAETPRLSLSVAGQTIEINAHSGMFAGALEFGDRLTGRVELAVDVDRTRMASDTDMRSVSVVVDNIEFD